MSPCEFFAVVAAVLIPLWMLFFMLSDWPRRD